MEVLTKHVRFKYITPELIIKYRSELMGICIVWIMLFHAGIEAPDSMIQRVIWYLFISFGGGIGVNIFFLLSGLGLTFSASKTERKPFEFYKRRFKRIIPAYLIVAIIFYLIKFESISCFFENVFFLNFIIDGIRDFWYIFAIFFCYLIFPLYINLVKKKDSKRILTIFLSIILSIICITYLYFPLLFNNLEIFLFRVPCFFIGCYLGDIIIEKRKKDYILTLFLLLFIECILIYKFGFLNAPLGISRLEFIPISIFSLLLFCLILELISVITDKVNRCFAYLGKRSLELYLMHVSIGIYLANLVKTSLPLKLLLYFSTSFTLAICLNIVLQKIEK